MDDLFILLLINADLPLPPVMVARTDDTEDSSMFMNIGFSISFLINSIRKMHISFCCVNAHVSFLFMAENIQGIFLSI
uniref:Uncharacterized protein n=1 Tax=Gossypium raimondii TaxID=29730 RepID=A0A0D2SCI8_GOSRA|nr:hypothetical protein B456_013G118600 [Gossypium raimondii]